MDPCTNRYLIEMVRGVDMAFEDRLKEARIKKEYTQEQIAEKIGIAKSTYTGYEKGNREPNVNTIGKLMEELGVDANFLWQDETTFPFELTYDEMENLVKRYRDLDDHGKEMVDFTLQKEREHSSTIEKVVPYAPVTQAAHNDHQEEYGEVEKMQDDLSNLSNLKRPE